MEGWNKPRLPPVSQDLVRDRSQQPQASLPCRVHAADTTITGHFSASTSSKDSYSLNIKDKVKMWLLGLDGAEVQCYEVQAALKLL